MYENGTQLIPTGVSFDDHVEFSCNSLNTDPIKHNGLGSVLLGTLLIQLTNSINTELRTVDYCLNPSEPEIMKIEMDALLSAPPVQFMEWNGNLIYE